MKMLLVIKQTFTSLALFNRDGSSNRSNGLASTMQAHNFYTSAFIPECDVSALASTLLIQIMAPPILMLDRER